MSAKTAARNVIACVIIAMSFSRGVGQGREGGAGPQGLMLRITSGEYALAANVDVDTAKIVRIEWHLENTGLTPVYLCQRPGISFPITWELTEEVWRGAAVEADKPHRIERKYFIELKPGEGLFGEELVELPPAPFGRVRVTAVYTSQSTGKEYGLHGWSGEIRADFLQFDVPTGRDPE